MTKIRPKVGDKVRVINKEAWRTAARVKLGQVLTVTHEHSNHKYIYATPLRGIHRHSPWSIPAKGLEIV